MPAENIGTLAVDQDRQLWMATYDGIVLYQGFDFRHFNRASQPALPGNRFMAVFPAPGGGVIVQQEDGRLGHVGSHGYQSLGRAGPDQVVVHDQQLWFICAESGALRSWSSADGSIERGDGQYSALVADHFGQRLLVAARLGQVASISLGQSEPRLLFDSEINDILGLAAGPAGEILVVDELQLRVFRPGQADSSFQASTVLDHELPQPRAIRATWTRDGWLLGNFRTALGAAPHLLESGGLRRLYVTEATSSEADRSPSRIELIDDQGQRWINNGMQLLRDGEVVYDASDRILDFAVDPFGQVWLAQASGGLRLLKQTPVELLGGKPGQLSDTNITLVTAVNDEILVGSWVGLSRFNPVTDQWSTLLSRAARAVLPREDGLLVGTHGLCLLVEPEDCRPDVDFPAPSAEVMMLHEDRRGVVWAGSESGLFRRDVDQRWQAEPVHGAIARTALEDASGRLLFGTNGQGILVLSNESNGHYRVHEIGPGQGLASEFVRALLPVADDQVLVGTEDAGLCLLDGDLTVVNCLSSADGLPHHSVHYMIVDESGRMWVNSNGGIYWVELQALLAFLDGQSTTTPDFYRYGRRQGLSSAEGNGGVYRAGAQTADGRIWFPNQHGLVSIRPLQSMADQALPLTTQLRPTGPGARQPLRLSRHARHLDLELTAIALAEPENVQFRYRFNSDPDWTEVGHRRSLSFRDLQPGRHYLEVSARHVNTTWSGPPDRLEFSAGYRVHEHPAFQAAMVLLALLAIAAVWLAGRQRSQRLELEIKDRSVRLNQATEQVAGLAGALQRVGVQHRVAFQAVSRELKSALSAAMEPLLDQSPRTGKKKQSETLRARTRTLAAMIDQIGRFAEANDEGEVQVESAHVEGTSPTSPRPKPEPEPPAPGSGATRPKSGVDLMAVMRMEVLLHLSDPDFSVDQLARRLGLSRSVLYRQVAELSDASPAELVRDFRLEQAARQLRESDDQVSTIAYANGFRSVSAFSRAFSRKFGTSPRQWRNLGDGAER